MGSIVLSVTWEGGGISKQNWVLLEEGRNGCGLCGQPTGSTNTTSSQPFHFSQMWEFGLHCQTETLAMICQAGSLKIPFLPRWEVFSVLNVLLSLFLNRFPYNGQLLLFLEILTGLFSEHRHRCILSGTHSLTRVNTLTHGHTKRYPPWDTQRTFSEHLRN